jgi:hypothetical protein
MWYNYIPLQLQNWAFTPFRVYLLDGITIDGTLQNLGLWIRRGMIFFVNFNFPCPILRQFWTESRF